MSVLTGERRSSFTVFTGFGWSPQNHPRALLRLILQFTHEPLASGSFLRRTGKLRSSGRRLQLASTMDTHSCVSPLRDAFRTFLREV